MFAGVGNALSGNNQVSGSVGVFAAIGYLAAGIVYLASRKSAKLGGDIANLIILLIVWILGVANAGDYADLMVWSWLALIIGVCFFVWHLLANRKANKKA